VDLLIRRN